jgi:hypothetical protein
MLYDKRSSPRSRLEVDLVDFHSIYFETSPPTNQKQIMNKTIITIAILAAIAIAKPQITTFINKEKVHFLEGKKIQIKDTIWRD